MTELITLAIDGQSATVAAGTTVIAAIAIAQADDAPAQGAVSSMASACHASALPRSGTGAAAAAGTAAPVTRRSVSGMLRGPLCGMGVCQECRVTIDGRSHQLACQTLCASGMQVLTALAEVAA